MQVVLKGIANLRRMMPFVSVYICVCSAVFSVVLLPVVLHYVVVDCAAECNTCVVPQVTEGHRVSLGPDALRAH